MVVDEPSFTIALPKGFLPSDVHQALIQEAVRRGVPLADLLREALVTKAAQINGRDGVVPMPTLAREEAAA